MQKLNPQSKNILSLVMLAIYLPLIAFAYLAQNVLQNRPESFDKPILFYVHHFSTPTWDKLAVILTNLGSPTTMGIIAALVLIGLIQFKKYRAGLFFAVAVGGAGLINLIAKPIFHEARPELWSRLVTETDYSFPSGHAMGSLALVLAIIILLWPSKWRRLSLVLGTIFILIIGLTRLYLGVHYPSDILAGWSLSISWVTIAYYLFYIRKIDVKLARI